MHIVHPQNIGGNGRIVIDKGRNEVFFLHFLHYNDTCKVNQLFTEGECKVLKLNILNINGGEKIQGGLWRQYFQNKNCLRLVLEIPDPTNYMNIVSYYVGDC